MLRAPLSALCVAAPGLAKRCVLTTLALVFTAGPLMAQTELNGAWTAVDAWGHDADGDWNMENLQPSLYLFLDGYYSIMFVPGEDPRPLLPDSATGETLTEDQLRSTFRFTANSGTYEVSGSTVTTKPMVAKWPNFMEGGSGTFTYRFEGDNLILTWSGEGWETVGKFQRLE